MARALEIVRKLNAAARAAGVAGTVDQFENISTQAQYAVAYTATMKHVHRGDRVLDWGCGNGHFSFFLASLGARITAYSFEPRPACMAAANGFEFVAGDEAEPRTLPFADATFDTAVGVGVLEHVWETGGDEKSSLAELARVIRPGGTLLTFHLPNRGGWIERVVHALRLEKHFHKRKFDEPEIRALWNDAGFEIVEMGVYNTLPRAELRHLPGALRHSAAFARTYDVLDGVIRTIAPRVSTNFFIVGRRREPHAGR